MPTEHSPLPWRYEPNALRDPQDDPDTASMCLVDANDEHAVCTGHDRDECGFVTHEDMRFIVRAVNHHHQLVEALTQMVEAFGETADGERCDHDTNICYCGWHHAIREARALLAQVQE